MPTVDLHTHSTFSDGTCSPEEVVHSALKRGVQLLSLTDHDTTDGTLLAQQVAQAHGLRFVPGVEISTCEHDHLHFTGYGVDITNPVFQQFLASNRTARQGRIKQVIKQLQTALAKRTFFRVRPIPFRVPMWRMYCRQKDMRIPGMQLFDSICWKGNLGMYLPSA